MAVMFDGHSVVRVVVFEKRDSDKETERKAKKRMRKCEDMRQTDVHRQKEKEREREIEKREGVLERENKK